MDKMIAFKECTPEGSLMCAASILNDAGFKIDFNGSFMLVYYSTDIELAHIKFIMDCCDVNCPYRNESCPDIKCHKYIKL